MIHVERQPPPTDLAPAAAAELAAFEAFHADGGAEPDFKAYKTASVRTALEDLFHGKCAYCESSIGHISSIDVEHWRPKGKIRTENGLVDGYWWLAGAWENLYPACPHCNRPTRHEAADGSTTAGKGMRFPIAGGRAAAPARGDELHEVPLLLDPCAADPDQRPELHLRFAEEKEAHGVVRAAGEPGAESELGETSMDVYALNRKDLVERRRQRLKDILLAIATIRDLLIAREHVPEGEGRDAIERTLLHQMGALKGYLADSSEYLLMARQFATPFLRELGIDEP